MEPSVRNPPFYLTYLVATHSLTIQLCDIKQYRDSILTVWCLSYHAERISGHTKLCKKHGAHTAHFTNINTVPTSQLHASTRVTLLQAHFGTHVSTAGVEATDLHSGLERRAAPSRSGEVRWGLMNACCLFSIVFLGIGQLNASIAGTTFIYYVNRS